jgi:hypothetical protein
MAHVGPQRHRGKKYWFYFTVRFEILSADIASKHKSNIKQSRWYAYNYLWYLVILMKAIYTWVETCCSTILQHVRITVSLVCYPYLQIRMGPFLGNWKSISGSYFFRGEYFNPRGLMPFTFALHIELPVVGQRTTAMFPSRWPTAQYTFTSLFASLSSSNTELINFCSQNLGVNNTQTINTRMVWKFN